MNQTEALDLYRKLATEFGRKGGRPRTIVHSDDGPCRCANCRKKKPEGSPRKKRAGK